MAGREFLKRQAQQAAALGHTIELEERRGGSGWGWRCSCGKASTFRRTQGLALGSLFHHAGQVVGQASRDGRVIPPAAAGDTPKITEVPGSVRPAL